MSKPTKSRAQDCFPSIDVNELAKVAGGASRVTARSGGGSNDQLTAMMSQITDSIKALSQSNNQSDPMQMMMMMMMMMGGLGGGGGGAPAPAPAAPPAPVINISTTVKRHGW